MATTTIPTTSHPALAFTDAQIAHGIKKETPMTTNDLHGRPNGNSVPPIAESALPLDAERIKVALADIDFDPHNANKHSEADIRAKADSIASIGLINEPLVYRDPEAGRYGMIAGEGRARGMLLLGWTTTYVRCLKAMPTEAQRRDLALIDNVLQNETLSDPLMFGLACLDNMTRTGRSARELAKVLTNKSASTITRAVARAQKLSPAIHQLLRSGALTADAANVLTPLPDADAQLHFARLYSDRKVTSAAELAAAIRAAKNGNGDARGAGNFTCEENGVKIAVTLPGQDLAVAEHALRQILKDIRDQGGRGLEHFRDFLEKKHRAAQAAHKLQRAKDALDAHAS